MKNENIVNAIQKILDLVLPCEEDDDEILCSECPFDIMPKKDCGIALLQERANMIKLEIEKDE